jgi:hypothetical protein
VFVIRRGPLVTLRTLTIVGVAAALFTLLLSARGTPLVHAETAPAGVDAIAPGPSSVDTPAGDRIGRSGLAAYTLRIDPAPAIDPDLDALAREQLRAAIVASADTGQLGPRLVHPAADVLVRIGLVSTSELDSRADLFSMAGPASVAAIGSAGGEVLLQTTPAAGADTFVAQVAAVAWRDPQAASAADELTATFGTPPQTQDELDAAADQRWLDQENRDRQASNFPTELLAHRHPVLDREAENTMRRRFGEPELPTIVDPTGQVALDNKVHFTAYACSPDCDPFWTVPDRLIDVLRQSSLEDVAARSVTRPDLLDFQRYNSQLTWAVQLPRLPHYWNSYKSFGVATRVHLDREVAAGRDAARAAVDALAPGGADLWDPREYPMDIVVIAYDPWPANWHRRP